MEIITEALGGLAEVFTTFVPDFIGMIVSVAENLFIKVTEGTAAGTTILGIVVLVVGVALVISAMRVVLRLLRIKRHA